MHYETSYIAGIKYKTDHEACNSAKMTVQVRSTCEKEMKKTYCQHDPVSSWASVETGWFVRSILLNDWLSGQRERFHGRRLLNYPMEFCSLNLQLDFNLVVDLVPVVYHPEAFLWGFSGPKGDHPLLWMYSDTCTLFPRKLLACDTRLVASSCCDSSCPEFTQFQSSILWFLAEPFV